MVRGIVADVRKTNPNFLNGVPELLVLQLLSRREMYGYELVREIQNETGQALAFGEGCIYPCLHWLERQKFVASCRKEVGGRSRNYYHLTRRGVTRLEELAADWRRVASGVALLVQPSHA